MKENKIRVSVVHSFRITDCNEELMKLIDNECRVRGIKSRVRLIEELSGRKLNNDEDVKDLRKWVKSQGFKTIEKWLASIFCVEEEKL